MAERLQHVLHYLPLRQISLLQLKLVKSCSGRRTSAKRSVSRKKSMC